MNSESNRKRTPSDDKWRPVAYERRLARATYIRVELMRTKWERPWRWSIFNLAAINYQRILAHGEEPDHKLAMRAALNEYTARTQRAILAAAARQRRQSACEEPA